MNNEGQNFAKAEHPEVQTQTAHQLKVTHSHIHLGPLPPPEQLIGYNEVVPNGAERIFVLAEKQAAHRQSLETRRLEADIKRSLRGLAAGFTVTILALFVSAFLIYYGHDFAGASIFGVSLVAIVIAFASGSLIRKKQAVRLRAQEQFDHNV